MGCRKASTWTAASLSGMGCRSQPNKARPSWGHSYAPLCVRAAELVLRYIDGVCRWSVRNSASHYVSTICFVAAVFCDCFGRILRDIGGQQNNNLLRAKPLFRHPQAPLPSPFSHTAWSKKAWSGHRLFNHRSPDHNQANRG